MHRPSRRALLATGFAGVAVLGLGGAVSYRALTPGPAEPGSTRPLDAGERAVLAAVAARVLRGEGEGFPDPAAVGAAHRAEDLLSGLETPDLADLRRLLRLVEHVLPRAAGHLRRFTRLSGEEQDAVLSLMETHPLRLLRGAFDALKGLCAVAFFTDPHAFAALGYDGPLVGRPTGGWGAPGGGSP